jgi:hypothetical protein
MYRKECLSKNRCASWVCIYVDQVHIHLLEDLVQSSDLVTRDDNVVVNLLALSFVSPVTDIGLCSPRSTIARSINPNK